METDSELERIRQFTTAARQRIRRLDVLLDEQVRILELDPALNSATYSGGRYRGHSITKVEIRVFAFAFSMAALGAFLTGFWLARFHH